MGQHNEYRQVRQDIFDILSHDERVIVCSNEGEQIIITWNQSTTFQMWQYKHSYKGNYWVEVEIINPSYEVFTFSKAKEYARAWFGNYLTKDA